MTRTVFAVIIAGFLVGCSSDDQTPPPVVVTEVVSTPIAPLGPDVVTPNVQETYLTGNALSSQGHPIEYRFDFDAGGNGDITSWGRSSVANKTWPTVGLRMVKAQARCEIHPTIISEWSEPKQVEVGLGPDTEITKVENTYFVGGVKTVIDIDFEDGVPDTVPFGSWITLHYTGFPSPQGDSMCVDTINRCLKYQVNYSWTSIRNPTVINTIAWRPIDAEDTNPDGVSDTTTLNIGSVEYTLRARTVDQFIRPDATPPEIEIIGNFDPTLDGLSIQDYNGNVVGDGDTVFWDWWNPANYQGAKQDTLDESNPLDPVVTKQFYFVIEGVGHDDSREPDGSGVKSWSYAFEEVGSSPPVFGNFARSSRGFVDGVTIDMLSDTARVEFTYKHNTDPGGASILNNLPDYLNKEYEYSLMGRDLSDLDKFKQIVIYGGTEWELNDYWVGPYGRQTGELKQRFFLKLKR